jgi:hypothetical protein
VVPPGISIIAPHAPASVSGGGMRGPFRPEFKEDAHTENVAYTMLFWHANLVRKKWQQKSSTIHSTGFPKTGLLNKSQTNQPKVSTRKLDRSMATNNASPSAPVGARTR